jgi:AraC-like DNA-binding protein
VIAETASGRDERDPDLPVPLKPIETLAFRSSLVAIGAYSCSPSHPLFRDSGPALKHNFSFARTSTAIERAREPHFIEGPDVVTLFNRGEAFSQRRVSSSGTRTDFFVVRDDVLLAAAAHHDPEAADRPATPFVRTFVPCSDGLYLRQRRLVDAARRGSLSETDVEESVLGLLETVLRQVVVAQPPRLRGRARLRRRELVEAAKAILSETFDRPLRLAAVAREVGAPLARLCRVFRAETGLSLSDYRRILRLRIALESLTERDVDLGSLAIELGFSSHSHFTYAFRRAFGCAPSLFRERERRRARAWVENARRGPAFDAGGTSLSPPAPRERVGARSRAFDRRTVRDDVLSSPASR